jgi:hypothetical protein
MTKLTISSTCSSVVGHFDGHGGLSVQYKVHRPMQHVQGYSRSHWTLPSSNYLLRIAPAAARATANKMTTKNVPKRLANSMAMAVRQYNTLRIAQ